MRIGRFVTLCVMTVVGAFAGALIGTAVVKVLFPQSTSEFSAPRSPQELLLLRIAMGIQFAGFMSGALAGPMLSDQWERDWSKRLKRRRR